MATKPTEKPGWVSGDEAARIQEPTGSKKLTGFLKNERPPFNFLNWLFNIFSHWLDYFAGNAQYNIIIDSDTDEGDYTSMVAYVADSPSAGDRILTKIDEVLTGTLVFPAGIEITQQKGKKFTLATNFSPIVQFGNNVKTKGDFRVENSDTGTIAKGFSLNGDENHHDNLIIENKSTGTITNAFYVESAKVKNCAKGNSVKSSGTITNDLTDNSGNDKNHITVKGDAGISRSNGAKKFDTPELITPTISDFSNAQHDHGDADDGGSLVNGIVLDQPAISDFSNAQHDHENADDGGPATFFKVGFFTRDTTIASGTQGVTGVGFEPKVVIFLSLEPDEVGEFSIGFDDLSTHHCIFDDYNETANTWNDSFTDSIFVQESNLDRLEGEISSMDSDGFTVTWTKAGTPTGTANIHYLAIR
jgi:hypothetical protein